MGEGGGGKHASSLVTLSGHVLIVCTLHYVTHKIHNAQIEWEILRLKPGYMHHIVRTINSETKEKPLRKKWPAKCRHNLCKS